MMTITVRNENILVNWVHLRINYELKICLGDDLA